MTVSIPDEIAERTNASIQDRADGDDPSPFRPGLRDAEAVLAR
jgi:hypothetical protein